MHTLTIVEMCILKLIRNLQKDLTLFCVLITNKTTNRDSFTEFHIMQLSILVIGDILNYCFKLLVLDHTNIVEKMNSNLN